MTIHGGQFADQRRAQARIYCQLQGTRTAILAGGTSTRLLPSSSIATP